MWRSLVALGLVAIASAPASGQAFPPPDFTIAFIGDQGLGAPSQAVLHLIQDEGADMVIHSGDFDYDSNPAAWDAQINAILGANFPYFASVGNHDESAFYGPGGYQDFMEARMQRLGIAWQGDLGALSTFSVQGIFFVMSSPGIFHNFDPGQVNEFYIRDQLAADQSAWRISSWHKDQKVMQVGDKDDETGWGVYEAARRGGAIIATAHEHSYSRTHLLSNCQSQAVASTSDTLVLAPDDPATPGDEGRSFVFVSGLGGESIRDQVLDGPWWASIYTSDQGANYGALFGKFHVQGDPCLAHFYFKDIDGVVVDEFFVRSTCGPCAEDGGDPEPTASGRIVWRRPQTGENQMWLLAGTEVLAGSGAIPAKGTQWDLAGTGDFDANGSSDLLWRNHVNGNNTIWLMDGAEWMQSASIQTLSLACNVAGVADFDGDGQADILWRRPVSSLSLIWFMDGGVKRAGSGFLPNLSPPWTVVGAGDFDGDGDGDILWRKMDTGQNMIWFLEGTTLVPQEAVLPVRTLGWIVTGVDDFDGDGSADILWRRPTSGVNDIWFMDGAVVHPPPVPVPTMGVTWSVAGTADFDGDGAADILWRKLSTGENLIWFMPGGAGAPEMLDIDPQSPDWTCATGD